MSNAKRNRWRGLLALQGAALSLWFCWQAISTSAQDPDEFDIESIEPDPPPTLKQPEAIPAGNIPWVGVSGCAAAACHGGPIDQPRGEYTTWISRDPHSRAYSSLFSEQSLEMARLLAGGDAAKAPPPHKNQLCLACHAPTGPASDRSPRLSSDGVGCEACHGAADRWATTHATVAWDQLSPTERTAKRKELGMTDMHNPLVRVQQCTVCHVGSAAAEVNHDLIAAGHPRLAFEMGAFHAELPKHWPDQEERRLDPTFEAKLWAIGSMTSAAAYYELLAAHSEQSFPDFADFDCFACHHELRAPSWRQDASQPPQSEQERPGRMQPLRWYYPPVISDAGLTALRWTWPGDEHWPLPDANRSSPPSTAAQYADRLRSKAELLNYIVTWQADRVDEVTRVVADELPANLNWDVATQWYLALVALERSRLDFRGSEPPTAEDKQVQAELLALKQLLNFPPKSDGVQLNSPRDFDPAAFRLAANRLQALLAARPRPPLEGGAP